MHSLDQSTLNLREALEAKIRYLSVPFQSVLIVVFLLVILCTFGLNLAIGQPGTTSS